MILRSSTEPAFGQADLSNCEREQIHLAGTIQPHGALIVVDESTNTIIQSSTNAAAFLNLTHDVIGMTLDDLEGDLAERIQLHIDGDIHAIPVAVRCHVGKDNTAFDCLFHRPSEGGLIVELERAGPAVNHTAHLEEALQTIVGASSLQNLCEASAKLFKKLTGYDRVMVYRFDSDGHGEVLAEEKEKALEAFLGNRYPASDIPQIARRLYEKNRVRVLVDVDYQPVPVMPRLSPMTGRDLDMSLCGLRSMSPIHIQYLKNMGVGATLVVSLMVGGKLWGLIACHHYSVRHLHYETRTVCELLAESIGTRLAALESFLLAQAEVPVRRLEQRMVSAISREGDWRSALFENPETLLRAVDAEGVALLFEDQIMTAGEVPGSQALRDIGAWLDKTNRGTVVFSTSLGLDEPGFSYLTAVASGIVAVPISNMPSECLIWFRPERVRTVVWGGNPFKPVVIGDDPSDLSPRRSFAKWHQLVEGTSEPWTPADLAAARLIGESLTDIVLQFRSVRLLIAQNQYQKFSREVRASNPPVVIADAGGRILITNEQFQRLLGVSHPHVEMIGDLPMHFTDAEGVRQNLREVLKHKRMWRGEVSIENELGETRTLRVRADPVFTPSDDVIGVVLLFTDLTERKSAQAARRRFQESIVELIQVGDVRLDSKEDVQYQRLVSSVVGNAQLAALEITDSLDLPHIPSLLGNVKASVLRTTELLEHLAWHSHREPGDED